MDRYNAVSALGIVILVGLAWLFSARHRAVNWRVVLWGTALQLALALCIFTIPAGARVFLSVNEIIVRVLDSSTAGARFVFGRLALGPGQTGEDGSTSLGFILAFQAFPSIVFFSALVALLYYSRVLPLVIRGFAWAFTRLLRVSGAESLVAASNIFVGVESALTVRPYLKDMTDSELCTVLTTGMATVASNVMALYVFTLRAQFPAIAGHLMTASLLSAPAALVMSKLLLPETGAPLTLGLDVHPHYERESGVFECVINGANAGLRMIGGIVALLIASLGLLALLDLILGAAGGRLNAATGLAVPWHLKDLLAYPFYPLALVCGVPGADAMTVARLLGERLVLTEVVAYQDLAAALASHALQHPRSAVIAAYALCGFAHVASMAIFVGGTAAVAPEITRRLGRVAPRALLAATFACLMTAAVAGACLTGHSVLLGTLAPAGGPPP